MEAIRLATQPPSGGKATLKEVAMVGIIGVMLGAIWATGDPAGAALLIQRLLK